MFRVIISTLLLTGLLLPFAAVAEDEGDDENLFGGSFNIVFRAGYSGLAWSPIDMEPYKVADYGRRMLYAEVALEHPLLILGDMFDIIQIPRLRVETNFGYSTTKYDVKDLIPNAIRETPYLRATGWVTMMEMLSFRYREETFKTYLDDPDTWDDDLWTFYLRDGPDHLIIPSLGMTNRMRDLEIGYISQPQGEFGEGSYEIGFFTSTMMWPEFVHDDSNGDDNTWLLSEQEILVYGLYLGLNSHAIPGKMPLYSQFIVKLGHMVGGEATVGCDFKLYKTWHMGMEFEGSYRALLTYDKFDKSEDKQYLFRMPQDVRYRFTMYTMFSLL